MPPKSATIHRPLPLERCRYPDNRAIEVTVVVLEGTDEKFFSCLKATPVGFLCSLLNLAGKELRYNNTAIPSGSDITFQSLLGSSDAYMMNFYIVEREDVVKVKIEDQDEADEEENGIRDAMLKPGKSPLCNDIIGKDLDVQEAVLKEALHAQTVLKSLLQGCIVSKDDEAEIRELTEQLEDIVKSATTAPTIVGIMGTTGSGKSSLVNALFGEELFPVSGTRACTAAPTEISYNRGDAPYRALIKFNSAEAWLAELDLIRQDMETAKDQDAEDDKEKGSPAESALAKVIQVYPFINRTNFHRYTNKDLLSLEAVASVLGKEVEIQAQTASEFYQKLQKYVDSGNPVDTRSTTVSTQMRYWPLVDVAKVYLKHWILETGVTLVDVPGGHDHNAARARSAADYASKCSAYLLVSKVDRASDDGFAMKMMSDAFRRQLRLDGGILNSDLVTFVCTQADNVSFSELKKEYPEKLEDYLKEYNAKHQVQHKIENMVSKLEEELAELQMKQDEAQDAIIIANNKSRKLRTRLRKLPTIARIESTNLADDSNSRKRKADAVEKEALESDIAEQTCIADQWSETQEECENRITEIEQQLEQLRPQNSAAASRPDPASISNAMCISVRNDEVTTNIQRGFDKEVDQIYEQLWPDSVREHSPVPVFVVSSKAFQVLSGHQQDDREAIRGFLGIEDTKVPALQEHCRSLTFRARAMTCKRALTYTDRAFGAITIWTGHGEGRELLTPQEMESHRTECQRLFDNLLMDLDEFTVKMNNDMKKCLNVLAKALQSAAHAAEAKTRDIVADWHGKDKNGKDRYKWMTYKAICRRNGFYKEHNWNKLLTQPLEDNLVIPWSKCFIGEFSALAGILEVFSQKCIDAFSGYGRLIQTSVSTLGSEPHEMLKGQLQLAGQAIMLLKEQALGDITVRQRELNRLITPSIESSMMKVYRGICKESGRGSFGRSKELMVTHIETNTKTIYTIAVAEINKRLKDLPVQMNESIWQSLHEIQRRVQNDCIQLWTPLTDEQYALREKVYATILAHRQKFRSILDGGLADQILGQTTADAGIGNAGEGIGDTESLSV